MNHGGSGDGAPLTTVDCADVCMPTLNAPNVGIERPPLAVRSNDGLGEMVAGETSAGKRQRDEQHDRVARCTAAEAVT